ncbi:MAG: selenide, water dikinase SelD [Candidatus Kapabacteria bacterium]|nr:selenide, water dikinase SelD [Candidatus Kapabacteria bacterium]
MNYKLTQYSHGAGCGCKISPAVLDSILKSDHLPIPDARLLVGNDSRDDAAVYDLGDGTAIVSTTDFFMPIVDDPFDFGRIASVNAISDIYAMGGTPMMAIAVLGWPINTVPIEAARLVLEGARHACADAGIILAGGHSIDSPEPIFGLAVTGRVAIEHLKTNVSAKQDDVLFLTKPLGIGILTTAQKKGILKEEHATLARDVMVKLNTAGATFATLPYVNAMTDVTGFGLMGHLCELCEGANLSAEIDYTAVPIIDRDVILDYLKQKSFPGGTTRNLESYGHKLAPLAEEQKYILCDPQTSGGLLVSVDPLHVHEFQTVARTLGLGELVPIGKMTERTTNVISLL